VTLGKNRADSERASDFMPDHHTAERRRQHDGGTEIARAPRDGAPENLSVGGMLQDEGRLEIAGAMEARGQPEVALEQRAGAAEQVEQIVSRHEEIGRRKYIVC
jgi:hypothetical protein